MQQKPENNLKEYTEFLDCPQHNQKESTSNNSNTKTNKKDGEPEIKDEEKKTSPHIFFYKPEEKTENENKNENAFENNFEDGYFNMPPDYYENYFQKNENEDEKFTELYDVWDNTQKDPGKDI
jgi:hypothetical protein